MKKLLVASALLCCASSAIAQAARTDRAAVANGESVYLRIGCQACHGTVGHGGAAPRLAPNTLPLPGFETWVRNGTPGWTIAAGMPAFSGRRHFATRPRGHPSVSREPAAAAGSGRHPAAGALEAPLRVRSRILFSARAPRLASAPQLRTCARVSTPARSVYSPVGGPHEVCVGGNGHAAVVAGVTPAHACDLAPVLAR